MGRLRAHTPAHVRTLCPLVCMCIAAVPRFACVLLGVRAGVPVCGWAHGGKPKVRVCPCMPEALGQESVGGAGVHVCLI